MKTNPSDSRIAILASITLLGCCGPALADGDDNFDNNNKSGANWGADIKFGNGVLSETSQRVEYRCPAATAFDQVNWPWEATRLPYNADWEIQVDVANMSAPFEGPQESSLGISIDSPLASGDFLYNELYKSHVFGNPNDSGFHASLYKNDTNVDFADTSNLPISMGAVRLSWSAATQVVTVFYDTDPANGYQWIEFGSFGLAGSGGATANTDWGLGEGDQFFASIYGYSSLMTVAGGQMYLDNFSETGGVASNGGPRPAPTGNFQFGFPVGNDLLTRIASITGNYQGVSPTATARNYDIDLAQDESGKVMAMGTVDGIVDKSGSPEIGGSIGKVRTVNGEPEVQLKGSFKGTRDGMDATVSGRLSGPVEVDDSGGTPMIGGTGTYKSKVAGVPFSAKNVPVQIEAPEDAGDNLKQDWSLELDLESTEVKGKELVLASATLVLPNGDTVEFPQKKAKYSEKKGYTLKFKKGTNTTVVPNAIDRRSSVILTGLKFERQGGEWTPVAGTIKYGFLGQKGIADLMEFLAP